MRVHECQCSHFHVGGSEGRVCFKPWSNVFSSIIILGARTVPLIRNPPKSSANDRSTVTARLIAGTRPIPAVVQNQGHDPTKKHVLHVLPLHLQVPEGTTGGPLYFYPCAPRDLPTHGPFLQVSQPTSVDPPRHSAWSSKRVAAGPVKVSVPGGA